MLLHDNAHPHAAARMQTMLQEFGWEVFEHPAYSLDLAPSDFHLFPKLKEFLGGRRFKSDEEVKDAIREWLNGLVAEVYDEGILKLITRYDKCLNVGGDYVEK
jgi:histone-lysine N-methyltransferase SETMAR